MVGAHHPKDIPVQISDIIAKAQGGEAISNLARTYHLDPMEAAAATDAVLRELSQRIERNTLSRGGVADLVRTMGRPDVRRMLDDPKAVAPAEVERLGLDVLDEVFWTKDRSRGVAARAAAETGVPADVIKKMLPTIAAVAMAGIAKGASGDLGKIVGQLAGSPLPLPGEKAPRSAEPVPSSTGGGVGQQSPLPVPGESVPVPRRRSTDRVEVPEDDNPYGDLGDIIRRGGFPGGQGETGGSGNMSGSVIADLIRGILGRLLGFENKGVLAWIINYLIFRWGIGFVKRLLSRIFVGR